MVIVDELSFKFVEKEDFRNFMKVVQPHFKIPSCTTVTRKSNIFSANMEMRSLEDICEITGYTKGTMPFKYLGVPISSKTLIATDCEMLVDKLVHTYWSSIFLLPKKVLKSITTICRNFLWSGQENTSMSPLIA
ncbi:hypothetical protein H5410_046347 [Solanum commersonii]|uniref:Uncharacterized protein n=1 Tax=Solanum commersonii TaxID=4109 RepID=A0A9J5XC03_SOLCO|nr:hypothetical protein H5410_046347 [Solanum commersonii]